MGANCQVLLLDQYVLLISKNIDKISMLCLTISHFT
jgi:hypothetical protein